MKLSEIAICLLYLQKIKYKMMIEMEDVSLEGVLAWSHQKKDELNYLIKQKKFPSDYFLINEFPMNSSFCYIFDRFKIKGLNVCCCPFANKKGCKVVNEKTDKIDGQRFILDKLEEVDIVTVMKFLKKIGIHRFQAKLKLIQRLWVHIRQREDLVTKYGKQRID